MTSHKPSTNNSEGNAFEGCLSCGMPIRAPRDIGLQNTHGKFCIHCVSENGQVKSFEEVRRGFAAFIMRSSNMDEQRALEIAGQKLKNNSYWRQKK